MLQGLSSQNFVTTAFMLLELPCIVEFAIDRYAQLSEYEVITTASAAESSAPSEGKCSSRTADFEVFPEKSVFWWNLSIGLIRGLSSKTAKGK